MKNPLNYIADSFEFCECYGEAKAVRWFIRLAGALLSLPKIILLAVFMPKVLNKYANVKIGGK